MNNTDQVFSIILAAGKGSRMNSKKPKVLHHLGGKPLLMHVLQVAQKVAQNNAVVIGHQADVLIDTIQNQWQNKLHNKPHWVHQKEQLGTGHAVKIALNQLEGDINPQTIVLILYGDVPLIHHDTLNEIIHLCKNHSLVLLSAELENPKGYGRIVRDLTNSVMKIVEHKDASEEERAIKEVNSGILATTFENLHNWTHQLTNDNAQKEYYLTDVASLCVADGGSVGAYCLPDETQIQGINSQVQRVELERLYQWRKVTKMAEKGLAIADAKRLDIRGNLSFGQDVFIDIDVIIEGTVTLEDNVSIGAHCILKDCHIGAHTIIKPYTIIEQSQCAQNCIIGPYARIRPDTTLHDGVRIGNFVEVKKSTINTESKVNHLSYVGDTQIGRNSNIGAGTITCNYDGKNKHQTTIGDDCFIGSGTQLIAPVNIGNAAIVGAGSTIYKDITDKSLGLTRSAQQEIPNWQALKAKKPPSDNT